MSKTRVARASIHLGDEPDDIVLDVYNGLPVIGLGTAAAINLDGADQATLDKLATVTAQAAANNRARTLRKVA